MQIKINGFMICIIRYTDDTIIVAYSDVGLQRLIDQLDQTVNEFGTKRNTPKQNNKDFKTSKHALSYYIQQNHFIACCQNQIFWLLDQ